MANEKNAVARYHGKEMPFLSTSLSKPGGLAEKFRTPQYVAHTARGDILATRAVLLAFLEITPKTA